MTDLMADLARAKQAVRTELLRGKTGRLAEDRVEYLLDDYQTALKAVAAHRLAEQIRDEGGRLGHNTNLAYRRAADLIDPKVTRR